MTMLAIFRNAEVDVKEISNQIWPIDKEKCVIAVYCFGDGQICPRRQCLGANKLSSYLHTQITEFRHWGTMFPPARLCLGFQQGESESLKCSCPYYVLYRTKHSKVFPRKQLKLSRKDIREKKRLGEVREVKHSGTARQSNVLIHSCLWLQLCNSTTVHCSAWNGRNMAALALLVQNYCKSMNVPTCLSETAIS